MEQTSATKRVARNFSWLLTGNILAGIINFISVVYIARVLGAGSFGLFYFAKAFLVYLLLLVDGGLSVFGTREIAQQRQKAGPIALNLFVLRFGLALIVFLVVAMVIYLLPISLEIRLLFTATFLFVFPRALNTDWVFQGLEKMRYIAFSKVFFAGLYFSLIVFLVKNPVDLLRVPIIQFVSGALVAVAFLFALFKYILPTVLSGLNPKQWLSYFVLAFPLGISIILIQFYNNLDTIMLGFIDRVAVVGYYNAAYQLFFVFFGLFSLWQATALPVVSKRIKIDIVKTRIFLAKYMRLTLLGIVPAVCLVFMLASPAIKLIFGREYLPAVLALQILIWALIPIAIGSTYGMLILVPAGHFKKLFTAVLTGAVVNLGLNLVLIPRFSYAGAAAATIVAEVFAGGVAFYYAGKILPLGFLRPLLKAVFISLVASLGFVLLYSNVFTLERWGEIALGAGFYLLTYLLLVFWIERGFIFEFIQEILGNN